MTNPESEKSKILQNRLRTIQSLQNPTADDLSRLVRILSDPSENPVIQAAVIPVFQKSGELSASLLFSEFQKLSCSDFDLKIKFSYALSQIRETPGSVYEFLISDEIPRVRQNAVLGIAEKNDRSFDKILFDILLNDPDPETAFEAAVALSKGGEKTLSYFESAVVADIKQNPYINSETNFNTSANAVLSKPLDSHVLAKVIEILGNLGNENTLPYLIPYCSHPDERIVGMVSESVQKIKA